MESGRYLQILTPQKVAFQFCLEGFPLLESRQRDDIQRGAWIYPRCLFKEEPGFTMGRLNSESRMLAVIYQSCLWWLGTTYPSPQSWLGTIYHPRTGSLNAISSQRGMRTRVKSA